MLLRGGLVFFGSVLDSLLDAEVEFTFAERLDDLECDFNLNHYQLIIPLSHF